MNSTQDRQYPILVVCCLIVRDRAVLMERHAPADGGSGYVWDLPGGKVENDETPRDALIREIREEMSIDIKPLDMLSDLWPSVWNDGYCQHWILAVYEAEIIRGEPPLSADLEWFPVDLMTAETVKEPDLQIILGWFK